MPFLCKNIDRETIDNLIQKLYSNRLLISYTMAIPEKQLSAPAKILELEYLNERENELIEMLMKQKGILIYGIKLPFGEN
jgi:hypothetical protein